MNSVVYKKAEIDIQGYEFDTVFVDPPRAGIDDDTLMLLQGFQRILYISCNPDTLHDNLKTLLKTHKIVKFAMFDQFSLHPSCRIWGSSRKNLNNLLQDLTAM